MDGSLGTGLTLDLNAGAIHASAGGASFLYNTQSGSNSTPVLDWTFARGPPASPLTFLSEDYFHLDASSGVSLMFSALGSVSLSGLALTVGSATTTDAHGDSVSGSLFTLTLTGVHAMFGSLITIDNGNLQLAVLSNNTESWTAVEGDSFGLTLDPSLSGVLSLGGTFGFVYNGGGTTGHEILDWGFSGPG